jgi:hypothetical protein
MITVPAASSGRHRGAARVSTRRARLHARAGAARDGHTASRRRSRRRRRACRLAGRRAQNYRFLGRFGRVRADAAHAATKAPTRIRI